VELLPVGHMDRERPKRLRPKNIVELFDCHVWIISTLSIMALKKKAPLPKPPPRYRGRGEEFATFIPTALHLHN
jgi:hypothetical protein